MGEEEKSKREIELPQSIIDSFTNESCQWEKAV